MIKFGKKCEKECEVFGNQILFYFVVKHVVYNTNIFKNVLRTT
jgi:hypothetical protein